MLHVFSKALLVVGLWALPTLSMAAPCKGIDLIDTMPPADHADLMAQTRNTPYPDGLLWRAQRGATTLTFFGSYHFRHEMTQAHFVALKPHIDSAQRVYLEISAEDTDKLQDLVTRDPSIMFITSGPTLPDLLGEADWQRLSAAMQARGIPGFMAAKFKPIWASMMLGVGPCEARRGAMQKDGIDAQIATYVRDKDIDSRSLEDFQTVLHLLDDLPSGDQVDMIRMFFTLEVDADDLSYTLLKRYLEGQVAIIWAYTRMISEEQGGAQAAEDFDLFEEKLLSQRNRNWVDLLLAETTDLNVFVAAGAAHLPGDQGVLNLLKQNGFTITALPFEP